jgi:acetylornithine deacetylase/succinyl-diaminopimelate desuccinylase
MTELAVDLAGRARAAVPGDEVVALAQELVRIPSENPPGDTRAACEAIAAYLAPAGFEAELHEAEPGFVSLVATHRFPEPGRTLLLNGHVDVVPVGATAAEWRHDPTGAEVFDGRLYGRGSLDMKGPVAAFCVAARRVVEAGLPLRGALVVTAVADEEQGGRKGSGALIDAGKIVADGVVIAEPSEGGIVLGHRGMCFVELTTHGRSAHASVPENGVSAVEAMVDALVACRSLELRHMPHPLLGSPSVAIGTTIHGGEKTNVVPALCRATLDIRHVPGMTRGAIVEDLERHFERSGLVGERRPDVEVVVWGESGVTEPDEEVIRVAVAAHKREFGSARLLGQRAATDGWWFTNRARVPTVIGLGPGGVAGCHVVDEHVVVAELQAYARVYADIVATFLGGSDCTGEATTARQEEP